MNNTTWNMFELNMADFTMYMTIIVLSLVGMVLNGFSIFVLWKCITTGELGIKLVLLSDFSVCFGYMIAYSIMLSLGYTDNVKFILISSDIYRGIILFTLFVSNWWIVILLLLRLLMLFMPLCSVSKWNKPVHHKIIYLGCALIGLILVTVTTLTDNRQYSIKVLVMLIPPVLVALEAGFIVFYCFKHGKKNTEHRPVNNDNNQRCSTSSSSCTTTRKDNVPNHQSIMYKQIGIRKNKPYNHIVITILALAFNFLIMDTMQFIDVAYYLLTSRAFPTWIMMTINISSVLKRIFNFIILCFKCPHFRKIMKLKLNLILRVIRRKHASLRSKPPRNVPTPHPDRHNKFKHCLLNDSALYCDQCQDRFLFIKGGGDVMFNNNNSGGGNIRATAINNPMSPEGNHTNSIPITSYCSVFDIVPQFMSSSQNTTGYSSNRLVISNNC